MLTATRGLRFRAVVLPLSLLAGCAGVLPQPPEPAPRTYLLAPDQMAGETGSGNRRLGGLRGPARTLSVSRPEDAAGYASARMAYVEQDYRLDYFADHAWVDSPAAMLGPLLVEALRGAFPAVAEETRGIGTDLRLDTFIESLYQDFRTRPSQARVQIRVRLVDPERGHVLASRVFTDAEPAPADDPYGGVVAVNRVLSRMLPEIAAFAEGAAARAGAPERMSGPPLTEPVPGPPISSAPR